ncbi:hypothetical protein AAF712_013083 [Marasmius tenuissimus]|uniref:Uncharacterized protein n=1 Tax=Marasmius tenuissimus TaxID=585030 RepID=A0ABR2ZEN4_9AGAR
MSLVAVNKVESLQLDLGKGMFYESSSPSCSEPSSPVSFYSQESESEDSLEEDITDAKPRFQDLSLIIPLQPDEYDSDVEASSSKKGSNYSSALSSPARDLPPHMDLPTLFKSEDVRDNDSFLDMEDAGQEDALKTYDDDRFDLADALTRSKPSSFTFECEEDEEYYARGDKPFDEIMQDRRVYLGDDWARLLAAIEHGVPLRRTLETEEEFGDEL